MNVAVTNVKHVRVELDNLLALSISIESWWWLWNRHSCVKSKSKW